MTACNGCHLVPRGKPICTLAYYVLLASSFTRIPIFGGRMQSHAINPSP